MWRMIVSNTKKEAGAEVAVGVRGVGVVHIEEAVVAVLVVVTADVDNRVAGVEVPVIAGRHKRAQKLGTAQVAPTAPGCPRRGFCFLLARGGGFGPLPLHPLPL